MPGAISRVSDITESESREGIHKNGKVRLCGKWLGSGACLLPLKNWRNGRGGMVEVVSTC